MVEVQLFCIRLVSMSYSLFGKYYLIIQQRYERWFVGSNFRFRVFRARLYSLMYSLKRSIQVRLSGTGAASGSRMWAIVRMQIWSTKWCCSNQNIFGDLYYICLLGSNWLV